MTETSASSSYSPREEVLNALTHGIGALAAVAGTAVLVVRAAFTSQAAAIVAVAVYGATMVLLYTASTVYHAAPPGRAKARLKIFDHVSIYLLIAGTYTPFTLGPLRGGWGWSLFGVIWGCALIGIVLKFFFIGRFRVLTVLVYVAMGWLVIVAIVPLVQALEARTLFWLVAGGIFYTAGTYFYADRRIPYSHGIWHVFVLLGSVSHYISIFTIVTPSP